jgi:hypothetical protein
MHDEHEGIHDNKEIQEYICDNKEIGEDLEKMGEKLSSCGRCRDGRNV